MSEFECGNCGHIHNTGEDGLQHGFCAVCGSRRLYLDGISRSALEKKEQYEREGELPYSLYNYEN